MANYKTTFPEENSKNSPSSRKIARQLISGMGDIIVDTLNANDYSEEKMQRIIYWVDKICAQMKKKTDKMK